MRKCATCGYLVLGAGETCKHCGAPLPEAVAQPVAAPPVLVPVGAPAPPPMAVPPVPPPFTRADAPPSDAPPPLPVGEYWTPPAPTAPAPPARSKRRIVLPLVVIVSMAFGWAAYDRSRNALPPGTSAFVAGHGVAYSSPDHTFDARFPSAPTVDHRVIPVSSTSVTINMAQAQTDDYEVVAASMVLPVTVPSSQVETVVHQVLNETAAAQGATISKETSVTHDGVPGVEIRAKVRDGYDARFIVLVSGSRVYMLGAHAKRATDRLYDALLTSLIMY
jgi:hypothetical protein